MSHGGLSAYRGILPLAFGEMPLHDTTFYGAIAFLEEGMGNARRPG